MNYIEFQKIIPNVSRETFDNLSQYVDFLLEANSSLNLISKSTEKVIWDRHIIDSMQLMKFINSNDGPLFDVGSGAGFPGIILSIAGVKTVYLVESRQKKANFLENAAKFSPNKIIVLNERVELTTPIVGATFVCRAFAPLNQIFTLCNNHINVAKNTIIPKGQNYINEVKFAKKEWKFNFSEHKTITSEESRILIIKNLTRCKK
jgi:16S rRNA (guanine527-N7)-methyltransferase